MSYSTGPSASVAEIAALVERRPEGYSLEAPLYTSPEIYEQDLDAIFGAHWIFVATEAEIPNRATTSRSSRRPLGDRRARRRRKCAPPQRVPAPGSRLLEAPCGSVGNIVCPYHQWTYRTDGSLIFAEAQRPASTVEVRAQAGNVRTLGGLVFVCLADEPPDDFDEVAAVIEPYLTPYRLADAKVAHQIDIVEEGNWKLVMENNRECHHCDASHPELGHGVLPASTATPRPTSPRGCTRRSSGTRRRRRSWSSSARERAPPRGARELEGRPTAS